MSRKGTGSAGTKGASPADMYTMSVSYPGLTFAFPGKGSICPTKLRRIIKKVRECNSADNHHRGDYRAVGQLG